MIFSFKDYKSYLLKYIKKQPKNGRGIRSSFARAIKGQTAFISQVLNGEAHFSMEQAFELSEYLRHLPAESKYFLLMVQKARAGSPTLRAFLMSEMKELREQNLKLSSRMELKKNISIENQLTYYSAWYYSAIHVALSIPRLQSPENLSEYFGLPLFIVNEALHFLLDCQLAERSGTGFKIGPLKFT